MQERASDDDRGAEIDDVRVGALSRVEAKQVTARAAATDNKFADMFVAVTTPHEEDDENRAEAREQGLIARVFPKSYVHAFALTTAFGVALVCTTLPQGLAYSRFKTRALDCYHNRTYYKLDPNLTEGDPHCVVFSYPYRLVEPSAATKVIPWAAYLIHQFGQWYLLRAAQLARDRGEISWPKAGTEALPADNGELSEEERRAAFQPNRYAQCMFALNMSMVFLKFVQSQVFYDGLASDVPEFSALYSVALWVLFAMIIEMPRRGLFFGYIRSFQLTGKMTLGQDFIPFVRKYHGFAISFGTTYNFWYHPIEGSPGFILGYLYQFCMILQSSFLFHPLHRNKFWTLLLELGVIPHSVVIAIFFANGDSGSRFQFGFGFALGFIITQMHGFDLKLWHKMAYAAVYLALLFGSYAWAQRPYANMQEVARMGMTFAFAPVAWLLWLIGSLIALPLRGVVSKYPVLVGGFWFLTWLAQMAWFVSLGPTQG